MFMSNFVTHCYSEYNLSTVSRNKQYQWQPNFL